MTSHKKHSEQIMTGCLDTNDRPVYNFGDAKRKRALSKVNVKVQPRSHVAHVHVHAQETDGVLVVLSAQSPTASGAVINFETGHAKDCRWVTRSPDQMFV